MNRLPGNLNEEERLFSARIEDMFRLSEARGVVRFSPFLDERQQMLARLAAGGWPPEHYLFFGGSQENERKMLGVFPAYIEPSEAEFPIEPLSLRYRACDRLSHRDFLGALMSLGITRESIGDIFVGEGICVLFVQRPVSDVVLSDLAKVGRTGIRITPGLPGQLPPANQFQELHGTVSSPRLDCVVAFLTNVSREKAQSLIRAGSVTHCFLETLETSGAVEPGDKISVRGYGKFLVSAIGPETRKGRLRIEGKKYC